MFVTPPEGHPPLLHAWINSLLKDHSFFRFFWWNLDEVIPGKVWRGNHPPPFRIPHLHQSLKLASIVNLRGRRNCGSDILGRLQAEKRQLPYIDMAFESRNAPHRDRILKFYGIYQNLPFPTYLHCKSGADRAGLASGLAILFEGGTAAAALKQLHIRYLHFKNSRTGVLDAFFRLYQREGEGRMPFIDWVRENYDEEGLRATFQARHAREKRLWNRLFGWLSPSLSNG